MIADTLWSSAPSGLCLSVKIQVALTKAVSCPTRLTIATQQSIVTTIPITPLPHSSDLMQAALESIFWRMRTFNDENRTIRLELVILRNDADRPFRGGSTI